MNNYTFWVLASTSILLAANQSLFNGLQQKEWGTPYDEWRRSHPAAKCRTFDGPGGLADEEWCFRCIETNGSESYEISFYAFDPAAPVCRLEQVRAWEPASAIAGVRREVESRYGPSDSNNAIGEWSSGFWHDVQHFRDAQGEIYLYRRVERNKPEAVELLARSTQLVAAKREDDRLNEFRAPSPFGTPLDWRLNQDLAKEFPGLDTLMAEGSDDKPRPSQAETLQQLLVAASGPPGRKAELLLAADRVASLMPGGDRGDQAIFQRAQTIGGFELHYRYEELGGGWAYQHDLLRQVWRESPKTEWGDYAFLLLQQIGWDTSGVCAAGSDQFREVIKHGEKFLAEHPSGPLRTAVTLAVGEAYETWWSLSRAGPNNDYVQPENYQAGAEPARQKAISLYEQLAKAAPASLEAAYANRELPRLKLSLDTVQRRYFCVYD